MEQQRKVVTIPPTVSRFTAAPITEQKKRRVAAYARVSTDSDEQFTSYEAQIDYYTQYIKARDDWEFVKVYTDEGITGTSTKHREGFKQMVADALDGRIDLIVTKSVSRFARNTVDSLTTIRQLKEKNVECFFEKENIWTFDGKGELLITIMSSLAQEESRSISENVTWGQRKRMADGKVAIPFKHFLGFKRGPKGEILIDEDQALVVKDIYSMFLQGLTPHEIACRLMEKKVPSPRGKEVWYSGTVQSILTNEKYKGDALMQKTYTEDFLSKKQVPNNGILPQYYVEGNHEAIIPPETFELVQQEFARRKEAKGRYSGVDIYSSRIICGECGSFFGAKVWHSTSQYRRVVFRCNRKYNAETTRGKEHGKACSSPHLYEDEIKAMFTKAVNKLISGKKELIANLNAICEELYSTDALEAEKERLNTELGVLSEMVNQIIAENARVEQDQGEYAMRYNELAQRFEQTKADYDSACAKIADMFSKRGMLQQFISTLAAQKDLITDFDPTLWGVLLDHMTVFSKEDIRFTFRDGTEIKV